MLSLTTSDIAGATCKSLNTYTNKPPKEEVEGSRPRTTLKAWKRPVMNLDCSDIAGTRPMQPLMLEITNRQVNPLTPTYKLASFKAAPIVCKPHPSPGTSITALPLGDQSATKHWQV